MKINRKITFLYFFVIVSVFGFPSFVYALDWYWVASKNSSSINATVTVQNLNTAIANFAYRGTGGRVITANSGCPSGAMQKDDYWESDFAAVPKILTLTSLDTGRQYRINTIPVAYKYLYSNDGIYWLFGNPIQQKNLSMICQPVGASSTVTPGVGNLVMSFSFDLSSLPPGGYSFSYVGGGTFVQWGSSNNIDNIARVALKNMTVSGLPGNVIKGEVVIPNYCNGVAEEIRHGKMTPADVDGNQAIAGITIDCLRESSISMKIIGVATPNNGADKNDGVTSLGKGIDSKLTFIANGKNTLTESFKNKRIMISSNLMRTGEIAEGYYEGDGVLQIIHN
ncbi:Uncharacterised protein [Escherichia coli]|uniref:hypothetical protein n=1 Tax=Escherichia coli TaxID=562 RepID=UPI00191A6C15|nr:hypothetical protein [Escherichia coli]CAD5756973.1 Uncharacterised protein [Escherichia coli]